MKAATAIALSLFGLIVGTQQAALAGDFKWSDWKALPNAPADITLAIQGSPSITHPFFASDADTPILIAARDNGDHLWVKEYEVSFAGGHWLKWKQVDGHIIKSSPSCVSRHSGRVTCYARTDDNALTSIAYESHHWGKWVPLGGRFSGDPAAVTSKGATERVYVESHGELWHWRQDIDDFSLAGDQLTAPSWVQDGGKIFNTPGCAAGGVSNNYKYHCFAITGNKFGQLGYWFDAYHPNGTGETGWQSFGGSTNFQAAAVSRGQHLTDVFITQTGKGGPAHMLQRHLLKGQWMNWEDRGGELTSAPACALDKRGVITCVARWKDGAVRMIRYSDAPG